jgi:hypothetical protein
MEATASGDTMQKPDHCERFRLTERALNGFRDIAFKACFAT